MNALDHSLLNTRCNYIEVNSLQSPVSFSVRGRYRLSRNWCRGSEHNEDSKASHILASSILPLNSRPLAWHQCRTDKVHDWSSPLSSTDRRCSANADDEAGIQKQLNIDVDLTYSKDRPNRFSFALALVGLRFCFTHLCFEFLKCRFNEVPSSRWLLSHSTQLDIQRHRKSRKKEIQIVDWRANAFKTGQKYFEIRGSRAFLFAGCETIMRTLLILWEDGPYPCLSTPKSL